MNIAGFYPESISNGEGWRAVLFVSGCPHQCEGCHNPETWNLNHGVPYNEDEVFNKIVKNEYLDGVTLSGGEPFLNYKELLPLVKRLKERGLSVWSYTGYIFEELLKKSRNDVVLREFLDLLDVVVDGPFIKSQRTYDLKFRGSSNQRLIDVHSSINQSHVSLYNLK